MGNKKLQIFGFWRLASWCKSFILSQLFLGLIVKNKLLNYVDITHTSISFMENAFPQWLIIISYFHLLSYKLDEIILLKKQWEVDEMSETMRGPPAPPTSTPLPLWPLSGDSHLLQHVVVLSCPHAHPSFPVLKLPSAFIPLLCIPLQEVTFFFRSWEVTFPPKLAVSRVGVFQHKQWQLYLLSSILGNYDSAFIGLFLWQDPFTWLLLLWFCSFYCLNVNHMK